MSATPIHPETPAIPAAEIGGGDRLGAMPCSPSFGVWDEEDETLKLKAELQFLKTLHIGDRVAVQFRSKMDDGYRMVECEPYTEIGTIVTLELHRGRGHISVHFDGEEKPTGPFKSREVRIIQENVEVEATHPAVCEMMLWTKRYLDEAIKPSQTEVAGRGCPPTPSSACVVYSSRAEYTLQLLSLPNTKNSSSSPSGTSTSLMLISVFSSD